MSTFEVLNLSDGTTIKMQRPKEMSDAQWKEQKDYFETNPGEAHHQVNLMKNAGAQREAMVLQTMASYYWQKIDGADAAMTAKMEGLQEDAAFKAIFAEIEANPYAAQKYKSNEQLMLKISKKMGGVPAEVKPALASLVKTPMTFHEACKMGSEKAVKEYLDSPADMDGIDDKDHKGISALGYAVGADRLAIVKLLIGAKADPAKIDGAGNSGAHYAAGYGRKEILEFLLSSKGDANAKNNDGKTPLDFASKNGVTDVVKFLAGKGGKRS